MRQAKARRVVGRMNRLEAEYEKLFLGQLDHGFEEITLRLGDDCRYTPDFWVIEKDGALAFHETKGHWRDDAKVKIRVAAEKYPQFRFKAFRCVRGVWLMEHFGQPDEAA